MSVYPAELRWRVVSAYEAGEGSYRELAERFIVDVSTVRDWMALYRATGDVEARRSGRKVDPERHKLWGQHLSALLDEDNDSTLSELARLMQERYGVQTSPAGVDRWLGKLGITRKKRRLGPVNKIASGFRS